MLFIDASRDFLEGTNQKRLGDEHIDKIAAAYTAGETIDKYAYRANAAENDFNLNFPRYVDTFEEDDEIDLMSVRAERLKLKAELEGRMEGYLRWVWFSLFGPGWVSNRLRIAAWRSLTWPQSASSMMWSSGTFCTIQSDFGFGRDTRLPVSGSLM
jgi:hypothetical protein